MPLGMEHHDGQVCISVLSRQGQMMMRGGAKKCSQSQVTYLRNRTTVEQVDLLPSLSLQYVSAHHIRGICGIGELLRLLVIKVSVWVGLCVCGLVRMYWSDIVCWPHWVGQ